MCRDKKFPYSKVKKNIQNLVGLKDNNYFNFQ